MNCEKCGKPAKWLRRCENCHTCDDCGVKEDLCTYTEGVLCKNCHLARVSERINNFSGDTQYTSEIICPYCGYEFSDSWELAADDGELDCLDCENEFFYERIVTIDYCTSKTSK